MGSTGFDATAASSHPVRSISLETLKPDRHQYGVEIFDDYSIIASVKRAYRNQRNHDRNLARCYLSLIENRTFYDAVWRIDFDLDPEEEILLFELKNSIENELEMGIPPMQGLTGKIKDEIARTLNHCRNEVLIAHKPFEPIPPNIKIKIITDNDVVNITDASAVVALLQQRRNRIPETTQSNIARSARSRGVARGPVKLIHNLQELDKIRNGDRYGQQTKCWIPKHKRIGPPSFFC